MFEVHDLLLGGKLHYGKCRRDWFWRYLGHYIYFIFSSYNTTSKLYNTLYSSRVLFAPSINTNSITYEGIDDDVDNWRQSHEIFINTPHDHLFTHYIWLTFATCFLLASTNILMLVIYLIELYIVHEVWNQRASGRDGRTKEWDASSVWVFSWDLLTNRKQ